METIIPFIAAFFIGGAFCAFFQMIQDHTHSIPPKILLVGIGAGALAAALGIMAALGGFAGAGTGILVIGFGEAVYMAIQQLLGGDWTGVLTNFVVLTIFCLMGVIAGTGHLARTKDKKDD
ncbi:MAG: SpoVA/SpoVAEb family sporulation membrane protein [Eggerthellaceae bacterium]